MRKVYSLIVLILISLICIGIRSDANSANEIVSIPDECLQRVIREKINKPNGDILKSDLATITSLEYIYAQSNADNYYWSRNLKSPFHIYDIEGIQYCTNLVELNLSRNSIKDISKLTNLKKLQYLNLFHTGVENISALGELKNLVILDISDTNVNDILPLRNLTNLKELYLYSSLVTDYSPILSYYKELLDRDFEPNTLPIKIIVDNNELNVSAQPIIEGGRTLVPIRDICEKGLSSSVEWNEETREVIITDWNTESKIQLKIGSKTAIFNGRKVTLEVAPKIFGRQTVVPVRFIAEAFGAKVNWNDESRIIDIQTSEIN